LEVIRQRLYEQAMTSISSEETQRLYVQMLQEETKLKEFEMARRKQALAEKKVRLEALRFKMQWKEKRGRLKAEVVEAPVETKELAAVSEKEGGVTTLLADVATILNRGGSPEEKVLEARAFLAKITNEGIIDDR
jgi:hypothetical protein